MASPWRVSDAPVQGASGVWGSGWEASGRSGGCGVSGAFRLSGWSAWKHGVEGVGFQACGLSYLQIEKSPSGSTLSTSKSRGHRHACRLWKL